MPWRMGISTRSGATTLKFWIKERWKPCFYQAKVDFKGFFMEFIIFFFLRRGTEVLRWKDGVLGAEMVQVLMKEYSLNVLNGNSI